MFTNISFVKGCYGCGVCAISCPKQIIAIRLNEDGFYEPYISELDKCINCSQCLAVCAYLNDEITLSSNEIEAYAGWSKDEAVLNRCSTGGIAYEMGRMLLAGGYKACGVKYNVDLDRAEHFMAENIEEFSASVGSKYIPSYTLDAFSVINRDDNYFVTGTPCQIDSIRKYIRRRKIEEHFVLMDFFCHGVPSMLLWKKYLDFVKNSVDIIKDVSWRNKNDGWHDSWAMGINLYDGNENNGIRQFTYFSKLTDGDLFYKFFLGNSCLGKACYSKCKYKALSSSADIRIGDLWGNVYKKNDKGVNGILVFTDKGRRVITKLQETCVLKKEVVSVVLEGQMRKKVSRPFIYPYVLKALKSDKELHKIYSYYLKPYKVLMIPKRVFNKIKRMIAK